MIRFQRSKKNTPMDNQRPLLFISLLFVLFLIWQAWQQDHAPAPAPTTVAEQVTPGDQPLVRDDVPVSGGASKETLPAATARSAAQQGQRIHVVTDVLDIEIDTLGGDVRRVDLPTYPVSLKTPDQPVRLLDDVSELYIAQSGLVHNKVDGEKVKGRAPDHYALYQTAQTEYRLGAGQKELHVPMVWTGADGVQVTKTFILRRGDFLIDVHHRVDNASAQTWAGKQYRQLRHGPARDEDGSRFLITYSGSAYYDGQYEKLPFDKMAESPLDQDISNGWVAILQHYFVSAWIPQKDIVNHYYTTVLSGARGPEYIIGLTSPEVSVPAGQSYEFKTALYAGPKLQEHLEQIAPGLELTTDYGLFTIFSQPLFWLLEIVHGLFGNWGWAIIFVTFLLKLFFYPLSAASYRSMAKMRKVQPKLASLKERYGDDKAAFNKAMMDFYKKEKINPVGGCLPMVIQIPVFIGFYWMLLESVELRQAPFMFWLQDLSTKDPYYVLPVLMGISMVVQQKMSPAQLDPVHQKIMMIMPVAFSVFFAFFPSGLVLYWFVNSMLSIAQQWFNSRHIK